VQTKLRRIRREHGFTSAASLASVLKVTHMCVHFWETGHSRPRNTPKFPHASQLEKVLQTPIATLLEPDNETRPAPTALTPKDRQVQTPDEKVLL
jgi:DNA-binding XRE family transcriptional regulator